MCLVRYLHPADHVQRRLRKVNKDFARELAFKDIKFPGIIREKKNYISISVFGYENGGKYPIYVSKNTFKRHAELLLIGEESKRHCSLIRDFNIFMVIHYIMEENIFAVIV